jgi:hypothetical protein
MSNGLPNKEKGFKSFGELVSNAQGGQLGAIRSFGEYLSKAVPTPAKPVEEAVEPEEVTPLREEVITELEEKRVEPKRKELVKEERIETFSGIEEAPDPTAYRIVRDRNENFECNIQVEGTTLAESQARIILESDSWNFTFYGKIHPDGRCVVPIKKGIPLPEGASGKIRLEVIADDQLFVGWEDSFVIESAKKVKVSLKESKSVKVSFD